MHIPSNVTPEEYFRHYCQDEQEKSLMKLAIYTPWKVYLNNEHIDTVFFHPSVDKAEVYQSLVEHDNLPYEITVISTNEIYTTEPEEEKRL